MAGEDCRVDEQPRGRQGDPFSSSFECVTLRRARKIISLRITWLADFYAPSLQIATHFIVLHYHVMALGATETNTHAVDYYLQENKKWIFIVVLLLVL